MLRDFQIARAVARSETHADRRTGDATTSDYVPRAVAATLSMPNIGYRCAHSREGPYILLTLSTVSLISPTRDHRDSASPSAESAAAAIAATVSSARRAAARAGSAAPREI